METRTPLVQYIHLKRNRDNDVTMCGAKWEPESKIPGTILKACVRCNMATHDNGP